MWIALKLQETAAVAVMGKEIELKVQDMAIGCIGCLLVFDTKAAAAEWVGDGGSIIQAEIEGRD